MKRQKANDEVRLKGVPVSPGLAIARVCLFNDARHERLVPVTIPEADRESECARLQKAFAEAGAKLAEIQRKVSAEIGPAEGEIFVAQKMMVEDEHLRKRMLDAIRDRNAGAEMAVMTVMDSYEARIGALDSAYLRERATDVGEVKRRLLDALAQTRPGLRCEGKRHCQRGRERVVVGIELTPSLTVDLDTRHLRGLVTEHGGVTSHAAILARALGIPAVSGVSGLHGRVTCGTSILVNGDTGEVIVWPSAATVARAGATSRGARAPKPVAPVRVMQVMANISVAGEASEAVKMKAEGVGLYRTEFEFMAAGRVLTEEEQFERYATVLKAMKGRPVFIRLLDIGGDKPAAYLDLPVEANPALGFRGARLLLKRPELVETQARAIARASMLGPIHVTYPMIVDVDQFRRLKTMVEEAMRGLPHGDVKHGAMFEVPALCLEAEAMFDAADYGSIGTNDLFQYLFAIDRNNELVASDYRPDHPVFWALIRQVVQAAERAGKPLSVCGEIAGWPEYVVRLKEAGVKAVSVSGRLIPLVRRTVANRA